MKYVQQKFIITLLRLILVSIVILVGAGIVLDIGNETHSLKNDELFMIDQRLSSLFFEINNFPRGLGQDVVFLSRLTNLNNYISGSPDNKAAYNSILKDFDIYRDQSNAYDKVEYIPFAEVEYYCALHEPGENLEDCLEHEEFKKKARGMSNGEVYISELHRNPRYDKGLITALHYMTPVFDNTNILKGIVVLTVNANYFLEDIRNYSKPGEMVYLIDSKGFYLAHPDQKKEFVASQDGLGSFVNDYPDISEKILLSNERRLEDEEYIFSLRRIYPTASRFEMHDESQGEGLYYWILVSAYKKSAMLSGISFLSGDFFVKYLMVFISVLILTIVGLLGTRYLAPRNSKNDENL